MRADIMTESSGRSKGCGTVLFETSEDAAHAICILNFFSQNYQFIVIKKRSVTS